MRQTDIKVWVLTGDKVGTARSIAMACKLIDPLMKEIFIHGYSEADILKSFQAADAIIAKTQALLPKYCMVTGDAMLVIAKNYALEKRVIIICNRAKISLLLLL